MMRRTLNESYGRPSLFGPMFVIAILACGYVLWRQNSDRPLALPQLYNGPAVQRTLVPSRLVEPAPPPDFVLSHLSDLKLTERTRNSLEALSLKSAEELRPLKNEADRASDSFRQYMTGRERSGRTAMSDIQAQTDKAEAAMRRANDAVVQYWRDATKSMTPDEKAQIEHKWQEEKQPKTKSPQK